MNIIKEKISGIFRNIDGEQENNNNIDCTLGDLRIFKVCIDIINKYSHVPIKNAPCYDNIIVPKNEALDIINRITMHKLENEFDLNELKKYDEFKDYCVIPFCSSDGEGNEHYFNVLIKPEYQQFLPKQQNDLREPEFKPFKMVKDDKDTMHKQFYHTFDIDLEKDLIFLGDWIKKHNELTADCIQAEFNNLEINYVVLVIAEKFGFNEFYKYYLGSIKSIDNIPENFIQKIYTYYIHESIDDATEEERVKNFCTINKILAEHFWTHQKDECIADLKIIKEEHYKNLTFDQLCEKTK